MTPKELAEEFKRRAAKARQIAELYPWAASSRPDIWKEAAHIWSRAAQMVEKELT